MVGDSRKQYDLSTDELRELARSVWNDYEASQGPFEKYDLPEYDVLYEIPEGRERANFLTLVVCINLNIETSGAGGLWQKALEAYESEDYNWTFSPDIVAKKRSIDLYTEAFKPLGWDDGKSHVFWTDNATTIAEQFDGDIRNLLQRCSYDALELQTYIQSDRPDWFPSLKGDKVSALWLRLLDEEVHELTSIDEIEIPTDRNILRVTDYLHSEDLSERNAENLEYTRNLWQEVCEGTELAPVHIDKPLWLCGKGSRFEKFDYWNNWGRAYLADIAETIVEEQQ